MANSAANTAMGGSKSKNYDYSATDQLKESAMNVKENIQECASSVKEEVGKLGKLARNATEEQLSAINEKGSEQLDRLSSMVKERPLTALAVGAFAGYVLGILRR